MFAVYEINGKPDYIAISQTESCCEAIHSCFPNAICHHTFPDWQHAKEVINIIISRTQLIEPLLQSAFRGATLSHQACQTAAAKTALSVPEAALLFGHSASHQDRLAMFNVLLQGGRTPAPTTREARLNPRFQLESHLLQ